MKLFKKFIHDLRSSAYAQRLTYDEKNVVREKIVSFMQSEPLSQDVVTTQSKFYSQHVRQTNIVFIFKTASVACAIFLIIGGSVTLAAQGTIPGDVLYPIKVKFTEPLQGVTKVSSESHAQWEITLLQRRLEEFETLSTKNSKLIFDSAPLTVAFEKQSDKTAKNISRLAASGNIQAASQAASEYEASLRAHERIVGRLLASASASGSANATVLLKSFHSSLQQEKDSAVTTRNELEAHISTVTGPAEQKAAENKKSAAQHMIENVLSFLEHNSSRIEPSFIEAATQRLDRARSTMAYGDGMFALGNYGDAFVLYQRAHRIAQEANVVLTASKKIKIKSSGVLKKKPGALIIPSDSTSGSAPVSTTPSPAPAGAQGRGVTDSQLFEPKSNGRSTDERASKSETHDNGTPSQQKQGDENSSIESDLDW